MNIPEEHLQLATTHFDYPYTRREAIFLWLVTAHSGHFLLRQFRHFAGVKVGKAQQLLGDKIICNRHGIAYGYGPRGPFERHRYHVMHRRLYRIFDRENANYRKDAYNHLIDIRLLALDYVIDHQDADYLLTEADRIAYFREHHGVADPALLPQRRFAGRRIQAPASAVYFPDRFPLGVTPEGIVFTYIDHPQDSLAPLRTHVKLHRRLFRALRSPWSFVFVSGDRYKARDAERVFRDTLDYLDGALANLDSELLRHFAIEDRWERKDVAGFTKDDYAEMGRLRNKFYGPRYRALYERWRDRRNAEHAGAPTAPAFPPSFSAYEPPTWRLIR